MIRILITDSLSEAGVSVLRDYGFEVDTRPKLPPEQLKTVIGDYHAVLVRSETRLSSDVIAAGGKLKVIGRVGVGLDNVDVVAAQQHGIAVINTPDANTVSTAEYTVGMLLALSRHIPQSNSSVKAGEWERPRFKGNELRGATVGIIGLGRIGMAVAARIGCFGVTVIGYDPAVSGTHAHRRAIELVPLEQLYQRSDYITIHTPLTAETWHMISATEFSAMKKGVRIINCARGGIVDELALSDALVQGIVAGAALDVFEQEPPGHSQLLDFPNVIATPHIGAATVEAQRNVSIEIATRVGDYLCGGGMPGPDDRVHSAMGSESRPEPYIRLAEQLGRLQAQIISGHIHGVGVKYGRDIAEQSYPLITGALLKGLLGTYLGAAINPVNAVESAQKNNVTVTETVCSEYGPFVDAIGVEVQTDTGTTYAAGITGASDTVRLISINGYSVNVDVNGTIVLAQAFDTVGLVGQIGTILGNAGIHIASLQYSRRASGSDALVVFTADSDVPERIRAQLCACEHIVSVSYIQL